MGWDPACEKLGDMYYDGNGVSQDFSQAMYYYKKADDYGDASANVYKKLGDIYFYGLGVDENSNYALTYYAQAVDKDLEDEGCFRNLGMLYYWVTDYESSAKYFGKAADMSLEPEDMYNCGCAYYTKGDYSDALIWYGKALDYDFDRSFYLKQDIEQMVKDGLVTAEEAAPYLN